MGLRAGEIIYLGSGILLLMLIHLSLLICFMRLPSFSFAGRWNWSKRAIKGYIAALCFFAVMFLITYTTYTYEHFMMNPPALLTADIFPLYIKGTSSSLYKYLGFKAPDRDSVKIKLTQAASVDAYPQQPIRRSPDRKKYNIIWIACESWAAKLYSPETMPKTAEFAKKGVLFKNHHSGGNVTRQGMFSMFYALPGNYWHPFFAVRHGPLLIDWLQEDGYSFKCITSSKFSYPEFDQTIFFQVPPENLHSDSEGMTYERDKRNTELLVKAIKDGADSGKSFFTFMFFESAHNPYEFPPEAAYVKDYLDPFIATQVTRQDGPRIFNRALNSTRHLDMCLEKVYRVIDEKNLWQNTIIVIAGDHGEEFYEHGYLGHSSSFVNEQIKTTLILYYPGITPGEYTKMSSHLDIVPMLAKQLGVQNDPSDYSCGFDLLADPQIRRRYSLIADWSSVFFAGEKFKSLLPVDTISFAKQVVTDNEDRPVDDVDLFYNEYNKDLITVQKDLTRFSAPEKDDTSEESSTIIWLISAAALIITAAVFFPRLKKRFQ